MVLIKEIVENNSFNKLKQYECSGYKVPCSNYTEGSKVSKGINGNRYKGVGYIGIRVHHSIFYTLNGINFRIQSQGAKAFIVIAVNIPLKVGAINLQELIPCEV